MALWFLLGAIVGAILCAVAIMFHFGGLGSKE